jgi:hypothetical protein
MNFQNTSFEKNINFLYKKIADLNPKTRYVNSVEMSYSSNKSNKKYVDGFVNLKFYWDYNKKLSDKTENISKSLNDFTIFGDIKFTKSQFGEAIIFNIKKVSIDFYECIYDLYSKIENRVSIPYIADTNLFNLLRSNPEDKTFGNNGSLYIPLGNGINYYCKKILTKSDIPSEDLNKIFELKIMPKRLKYKINDNNQFSIFIDVIGLKVTNHNLRTTTDLDINEINFDEEPENTDEIKNVIDNAFNKLKLN